MCRQTPFPTVSLWFPFLLPQFLVRAPTMLNLLPTLVQQRYAALQVKRFQFHLLYSTRTPAT
jgi:hypothetical protein